MCTYCIACGTLLSAMWWAWREWGWGGMDACINMCMAESLPCSPGTVTTLLISYTPGQNTKFKRKTSGGGSIRDISKQCLYSRL